jgi:FlaA1/EpsC-like NDP-sugar epimerase
MRFAMMRLRKYLLLGLADIVLLLLSWELTYYIQGQHIWAIHSGFPPLWVLLAAVAFQVAAFAYTKVYKISLRQVSLELVYQAGLPLVIGHFFSLGLVAVRNSSGVPDIALLLPYYAFSILALFAYRIIFRLSDGYTYLDTNHVNCPRALLYGAGEVADQLLRLYRKDMLEYKFVGIMDDDAKKHHLMMHGFEVLGSLNILEETIDRLNVEVVIIASMKIKKERLDQILEVTNRNDVDVKIVPSLFEIESNQKKISELRDIDVNDLLGREPIVIDKEPIIDLVEGKTVLVTGAGGSIGCEISSQLIGYSPKKIIVLDIDETEIHNLALSLNNYTAEFSQTIVPVVCDVKDGVKIKSVMEQYRPDIVFHAAAYKHVPLMEYYPEEAIRTNVMGTHSVLKAAMATGVSKCIVISTDKAVNPTNVMGATKRMAELIGSSLSSSKTEIVSVRFGNVLGSRGSMLPLFFDQIKRGLPITVTHKDIIRYFMTIPEAVSLVFLAGAIGKGGEVMVLDMGKPIKIYDFAQNLIKRFGDGRSTVIVTGLRPGEKLYEELLTKEDEVIRTSYEKVFKARVENGHDIEIIERFIGEIPESATEDLLQTLGSYVPFPLAQKIQEKREAYLS